MNNIEQIPFVYGKVVSVKSFVNRDLDRQRLADFLLGGVNVMLLSPRRWGKSSLVEKTMSDIATNHKKVRIVQIDMFSVETQEEFFNVFAKEILKATHSRLDDILKTAKSMFSNLIPKISISTQQEFDFNLSFDKNELKKSEQDILNLPELIAQKKGVRVIICIDEFQDLALMDNYKNLEKKMRACWQKQKNVSYCLYGSKRHMMQDIFSQPSRPFYRFGNMMVLKKIASKHWVEFIKKSFESTEKSISSKYAILIPKVVKNHSWYVQQFSHFIWIKTEKKVTVQIIREAYDELVRNNLPLFQNEIESLTSTQINLLKAIAKQEKQLSSLSVLTKYNLVSSANVNKARKVLLNKDIIEKNKNGYYEFLDPVFEVWFKSIYFKIDFYKIDEYQF